MAFGASSVCMWVQVWLCCLLSTLIKLFLCSQPWGLNIIYTIGKTGVMSSVFESSNLFRLHLILISLWKHTILLLLMLEQLHRGGKTDTEKSLTALYCFSSWTKVSLPCAFNIILFKSNSSELPLSCEPLAAQTDRRWQSDISHQSTAVQMHRWALADLSLPGNKGEVLNATSLFTFSSKTRALFLAWGQCEAPGRAGSSNSW